VGNWLALLKKMEGFGTSDRCARIAVQIKVFGKRTLINEEVTRKNGGVDEE
jgi:hypothetical protein